MLKIKKMSLQELEIVLGWAATEGWNPGLDDAAAFLRSDTDGFLLGSIDGKPACAVSVVRYNPDHGFLGLYLCLPEYRGQGHGWTIWNAGIKCLGECTIGLDGVLQQQDNYRKSGFTLAHRNIRYTGPIVHSGARDECVDLSPSLQTDFIALDKCASGSERPNYMGSWTSPSKTRKSVGYVEKGRLIAAGTIRECLQGHKIGPIFAPNQRSAEKIINSLINRAKATQICIDAPESNPSAIAMVRNLNLEPVFETARMYRGTPISTDPNMLFGVATLELG